MLLKAETNMARLTFFVLLLAVVSSAQAEVMDKEPSLMQIILWGLVSSTIRLFAARYKPVVLVWLEFRC